MSQSTPTDSLNQSCDECDFRKQLYTYKKINRKVFFRIDTTVIVYLFFINFSAYPNQYKTVTERIIMIVKQCLDIPDGNRRKLSLPVSFRRSRILCQKPLPVRSTDLKRPCRVCERNSSVVVIGVTEWGLACSSAYFIDLLIGENSFICHFTILLINWLFWFS